MSARAVPSKEPSLYDRPRHVLANQRHHAANELMVARMRGRHSAERLWTRILTDLDSELNRTRESA